MIEGAKRDREVAKAALCGMEAVDGVEVDGSRGMRRDVGRGGASTGDNLIVSCPSRKIQP